MAQAGEAGGRERREGSQAMTDFNLEVPVGELVAADSRRARVFERLGIDYCCGGRTPLDQACRARGLDIRAVLDELALDEAEATAADRRHESFDGKAATIAELIEHIVAVHHAYLLKELPRLSVLVDQVLAAHGIRHPELAEVRDVFRALKDELTWHMRKEEKVLFPIIAQLAEAAEQPEFHCGSVTNPIRVMEHEHTDAASVLGRLRTLTGGYSPPADACTSYRALFDGLAELEADLHLHIHEENNVLFPRARAAEDALVGQGPESARL
jgi:regulator of cell morphogenesis and NO signaling